MNFATMNFGTVNFGNTNFGNLFFDQVHERQARSDFPFLNVEFLAQ